MRFSMLDERRLKWNLQLQGTVQIHESGNAQFSSQPRPNKSRRLKRVISKMVFGGLPACCVQTPNPPSGEAKTRLFAHRDPFGFNRQLSVGFLGEPLNPIASPSPERLHCAQTGLPSGPQPAFQDELLHCSTILLRNRAIEPALGCSATEGGTDAS